MSYQHLSLEERYYIEIEHKKGTSQKKIAEALGRNQGGISRELARNTGQRGYRHHQANSFTQERHKTKVKAIKITENIAALLEKYVREDWSPEQIAGRLKSDGTISLHHETIYHYILADKKAGGELAL
jgi:IS30 family transposase